MAAAFCGGVNRPIVYLGFVVSFLACGPRNDRSPQPSPALAPAPDAQPRSAVPDPEKCWRITDGTHRGAVLCREIDHGDAVGGLVIRRDRRELWRADFNSVLREGAAGSTYVSYRLDGTERAVMRHCNACDEPGFTELRAVAKDGFWSRLAPLESHPSLTLRVGLLLTKGNVRELVELSAKTLEVEIISDCGEPPFANAAAATLTSDRAKREWLLEAQRWWRPECASSPAPDCRWSNPIETSGHLMCDAGCCSIASADRHNTPFLRQVCFASEWVSALKITDGC